MGGKNSSKEPRSSQIQANLAQQLFEQSDPIRSALFDRSAAFLGVEPNSITGSAPSPFNNASRRVIAAGRPRVHIPRANPTPVQQQSTLPMSTPTVSTLDPTQSILFTSGKQAIEDQFGNAKESIIASGATGGALADKLAELELNKAKQIGSFQSGLAQDELNRAFTLATGTVPQINSALTSSAAAQAQAGAARSQAKGDKGRAAGFVAGTALTKNPAGGAAVAGAAG